eukprot:1161022-Pelagomonas_calceolata.AAC.8
MRLVANKRGFWTNRAWSFGLGLSHSRARYPLVKELGLNHLRASKLACGLHAHCERYRMAFCKRYLPMPLPIDRHRYMPTLIPTTTRHGTENNKTPHSQALELGASSNPPDPHYPSFLLPCGEGVFRLF